MDLKHIMYFDGCLENWIRKPRAFSWRKVSVSVTPYTTFTSVSCFCPIPASTNRSSQRLEGMMLLSLRLMTIAGIISTNIPLWQPRPSPKNIVHFGRPFGEMQWQAESVEYDVTSVCLWLEVVSSPEEPRTGEQDSQWAGRRFEIILCISTPRDLSISRSMNLFHSTTLK